MKIMIKVGNHSNPENHIKLNDPSSSKQHAEVELRNATTMYVRDTNSKYGTYVNRRRIISKIVGLDDVITFGHTSFSGKELILECQKVILEDKVHWENEFNKLQSDFKKYKSKKKQLKNRHNVKLGITRVVVFALFFMCFSYVFKFVGIDPTFRTVVIIGASMAAALVAGLFVSQEKLKESLHKLDEDFDDILVCPNPQCRLKLRSKSFMYWRKKRKCPKCQANWVVH